MTAITLTPDDLAGLATSAELAALQQRITSLGVAAPLQDNEAVHVRYPTHATQLYRELTLLQELCVDFVVTAPVDVEITGHVEVAHRNLTSGDIPVGVAAKLCWRRCDLTENLPPMPGTRAPTQTYTPGNWIKGGKSGQNINGITDHYGRMLLMAPRFTLTTPGKYRIEVWGTSHTSSNALDGNAMINVPAGDPVAAAADPYGFMQVSVTRIRL